MYEKAGVAEPDHLARRVSGAKAGDEAALIDELWPGEVPSKATRAELEAALVEGVLRPLTGSARLLTDRERAAEEQVSGNRYVGLQIQVAYDDERKLAVIKQAFPGGPAERAGMNAEDRIEAIEGQPMRGVSLRDVVERLRGDEGTSVDVTVRQPGAEEARTLSVRREALPRELVKADGPEDSKLPELPPSVGYLRVEMLASSVPHELRKHEARLRAGGKRALILDLRGCHGTDPHSAVLAADGLLDEGPIGRLRTASGVREYQADPDALFRDWPLIVLIDGRTAGSAEWLAAALKDRGRAKLVGLPTRGAAFVFEPVRLPDGSGWVSLMTGILERGDGRPLRDPPPPGQAVEMHYRVTPDGRAELLSDLATNGQGVRPDHAVPADDKAPADTRTDAAFNEAVKLLTPKAEANE